MLPRIATDQAKNKITPKHFRKWRQNDKVAKQNFFPD